MSHFEILLLIIIIILVAVIAYTIWRIYKFNSLQGCPYDRAPIGMIRQNINGGDIYMSNMANDIINGDALLCLEDIGKLFCDKHSDIYHNELSLLKSEGEDFAIIVDGKKYGHSFHVLGNRSGSNLEIWIEDSSLLIWLSKLLSNHENELLVMQALFDILPFPVWWREGKDLSLSGCNKIYAKLLAKNKRKIISEQIELGDGVIAENGKNLARRASNSNFPQSESHYLVVDGKRRLFDFNECKMTGNEKFMLGYAIDQTHMEESQSILGIHMSAHNQVLEMIGSAIVIYGSDKRLKFFNSAYCNMWNLNDQILQENMLVGEIIEILRNRNQMPEIIDFPTYKKQLENKFNSLMESEEELLHLPDERTIRMVTSPHPLGGLMFVFEDVTNSLALEQSYNTLIAVQQETMNNLYEGVAVFGSDGRVNVWNKVFSDIWHIPEKILYNNPHISELIHIAKSRLIIDDDWEYKRNKLILSITNPTPSKCRTTLVDGMVLDIINVPLPDGQCLVLYQDVSDKIRIEKELSDSVYAFEEENLSKIQLLENLSKKLHSSLHSIQGLTNILQRQDSGKLNIAQKKYIDNINQELDVLLNITANDLTSNIDR